MNPRRDRRPIGSAAAFEIVFECVDRNIPAASIAIRTLRVSSGRRGLRAPQPGSPLSGEELMSAFHPKLTSVERPGPRPISYRSYTSDMSAGSRLSNHARKSGEYHCPRNFHAAFRPGRWPKLIAWFSIVCQCSSSRRPFCHCTRDDFVLAEQRTRISDEADPFALRQRLRVGEALGPNQREVGVVDDAMDQFGVKRRMCHGRRRPNGRRRLPELETDEYQRRDYRDCGHNLREERCLLKRHAVLRLSRPQRPLASF